MRTPRRLASLLVLVPALVGSPVAHAEPTGEDFEITYFKTDASGDRSQMTVDELRYFNNKARCDCNQEVSVRVRLKQTDGTNPRIVTYVGRECAQGQVGNNNQIDPCVELVSDRPTGYTQTRNPSFSPVWIASGVAGSSPQEVESAFPRFGCDDGRDQDSGIWICVLSGGTNSCGAGDFVVNGDQNINSVDMPTSLSIDMTPPDVGAITGLSAIGGDGSLAVTWGQQSTTDIYGFRVLCATADGNPVPGKGASFPTDRYRNDTYFTESNLCPDGPFNGPTPAPQGGSNTDDDGTTGGSTSGDGSGDGTGDGAGTSSVEFRAGSGTGTDGSTGGTGTSTDTGTNTDTTTNTTDTSGASGSDTTGATGGVTDPSEAGIRSLGWGYICSDFIAANATSARVDNLVNDVEYQVMLVAFDQAGNPAIVDDVVLRATPAETDDLWDRCEKLGSVCGDGGFCACQADAPKRDGWPLLALGLLGLWTRRHRRRPRSTSP